MYDGHIGIENTKVNSGGSKAFELILSYLKQGDGSGEFIIHATSNVTYVGGSPLQPLDFLANIGFTKYHGQCQFHRDRCFYRSIATLRKTEHGFEHYEQVEYIHRHFSDFAKRVDELFELRQKEYNIISQIGLKPPMRGVLPAPYGIEISTKDIPAWVQKEKFQQLLSLEEQKNKIQDDIDFYQGFLPLLYSTGDILENAVIHGLRFLGLKADKAEKGFTVDVFAETGDKKKRFGLEITGINEAVKKNSRKLTQVLDFERIKEHDEKTILLVNSHNGMPVAERSGLENFTQPVIDFLGRHPILMMTSLDLYRMIKDVLEGRRSKENVIETMYTKTGVLTYSESDN